MIRAVAYVNNHVEELVDLDRISDLVADPKTTVWLDILMPDEGALDCLREEFGFHPLTLEDVVRRHQRPKIEIYPDYYFLVIYALHVVGGEGALAPAEIEIFLGSNYVVTVHAEPVHEIDEVWRHWRERSDVIGADAGALLYALFDHIVDDYFPVIDDLADRVEDIEEQIFQTFDAAALESIFDLKKDLLALRRIVAPERDVLNVLLRRDPPILPAHAVPFFQNIFDHVLRLLDSIDTYRDLLSSALDAYLSVQSNNLNEIMRRLTIISTIFLPLTFLTGFFGMNFTSLPYRSPAAFWISVVIMALTPAMMLLYFHWRRWS